MTRILKATSARLLWAVMMGPAPGWAGSDPYPPLDHHTFVHDGVLREYFVHAPRGAEGPMPVVIAIHGYTSTATGFAVFHDLREHADRNGYIVVYPQGRHFTDEAEGRPYRVTSWNMLGDTRPDQGAGPQCTENAHPYPCPPDCGDCGRCAWASCGDDLGYFETLLDQVAAAYPTDPERYYALGMSNGGMMALRLGCSLSHRFAAIAPIDAQMPAGFDCVPATPLPMIHLSGGRDNVVRPDGKPSGDGFIYVSVAQTAATWARALGCVASAEAWTSPAAEAAGLVCSAYGGCGIEGQEVVACSDPEETHNWPARRPGGAWPTCVTAQQAATMPEQDRCAPRTETGPHRGMDLIWEFFRRFERAPGKMTARQSLPDPLAAGWQGERVCEKLHEDEKLRILRCVFPPGVGHERHWHPRHFGYNMAGGRLSITDAGGTRVLDIEPGDSFTSDGVAWHEALNIGASTLEYLIVEPK